MSVEFWLIVVCSLAINQVIVSNYIPTQAYTFSLKTNKQNQNCYRIQLGNQSRSINKHLLHHYSSFFSIFDKPLNTELTTFLYLSYYLDLWSDDIPWPTVSMQQVWNESDFCRWLRWSVPRPKPTSLATSATVTGSAGRASLAPYATEEDARVNRFSLGSTRHRVCHVRKTFSSLLLVLSENPLLIGDCNKY